MSGCRVCSDFKSWASKTEATIPKAVPEDTRIVGAENSDMPCPPDSQELGSSTWTFLHTMASYYPDKPEENQIEAAKSLISSLSILYPCSYCAKHMREELQRTPATVESRDTLERWMCDLHNEVNERLGKTKFDCSRVRERWKDGCQ